MIKLLFENNINITNLPTYNNTVDKCNDRVIKLSDEICSLLSDLSYELSTQLDELFKDDFENWYVPNISEVAIDKNDTDYVVSDTFWVKLTNI